MAGHTTLTDDEKKKVKHNPLALPEAIWKEFSGTRLDLKSMPSLHETSLANFAVKALFLIVGLSTAIFAVSQVQEFVRTLF